MKHTTREETLNNGIKLLLIDIPDSRYFDMAVAVNAGYRFATDDEDIISSETPHILEHCVFDGSSRYESGDALQSVFDLNGGEWNGITTPYHNLYTFHNKPKNAKTIIDAALNMVFFPALSQQSFSEECDVVANELQEKMGDFSLNANLYAQQAILPDLLVSTDYSLEVLGTSSHEEVVAYHRAYYTTNNTTVVIACDMKEITRDVIVEAIAKATNNAPKGTRRDMPRFTVSTENRHTGQPLGRSITTSTLALQYAKESPALTPQESAVLSTKAAMFATMVSNMKSYSVQYRLRKQGLAYGVMFAPLLSIETYGFEFTIEAPNDRFKELLTATLSMTTELAKDGITDQQFTALKEDLIESYGDIDSPNDIMTWYLEEYLIESSVLTPEDYKKIAQDISQNDVLSFARDVLRLEQQYISLFSAKQVRLGTTIELVTDAIFTGDAALLNPKEEIANEFNRWYEKDSNATGLRRFTLFINTRPFLAWTWIALSITIGVFVWYYYFFILNERLWWQYIIIVIGTLGIIDGIGDGMTRILRYRKR